MSERFDGKRILVTGGTSGIGFAAAKAFGALGAAVTVAARSRAGLDHALGALVLDGVAAEALCFDVCNEEEVIGAIAGRTFDVLVNNAGTHAPGNILDIASETFDTIMAVNVRGAFLVARTVAQSMVSAGIKGVIIQTSSQLGHVGAAGRASYTASKHALEGLNKCMALDLAPYGIRCVCVSPTFTRTEMTERASATSKEFSAQVSRMPLARLAEPEEIASVMVFVASSGAAMITGSSIMADGGWTCL
ncbi:SDR family oxidoreductase [Bosea vestrisii]|uniref:SDR family NAD(P)-dependent oxidoreductase n=1 Tax=Bosea vestrisii TaxID=151416 RepID=UPI0024DF8C15|nr:SDR family oxidoreductase [Bosea vestrisii]WID98860.1 SDR family oxidoreductase [Bosea vestrisii]